MRTLAIDWGAKRIGLAQSDEGGRFATPLEVLEASAAVIDQIVRIVAKEGIERIVVGMPLNMDGTVGPAGKTVLAFGEELFKRGGKEVALVDERLSSFEAEESITQRRKNGEKITRGKKKKRLDVHAAAIILQGFLDGKVAVVKTIR